MAITVGEVKKTLRAIDDAADFSAHQRRGRVDDAVEDGLTPHFLLDVRDDPDRLFRPRRVRQAKIQKDRVKIVHGYFLTHFFQRSGRMNFGNVRRKNPANHGVESFIVINQ